MYIHDIDPTIVNINLGFVNIPLRYYGLFFGSGILTAFLIARTFFRKLKYDDKILDKILIYVVVTIVIMAHLVHLVFYEPDAITEFKIMRIINVGRGLASHGGFIGGLLGLYLFLVFNLKLRKPYLHYADLLMAGSAIFPVFVRLGNWFNSEIYGRVTDSSLGVVFKRAGESAPRHPSQLYEAIVGLIIFLIIFTFYRKNYKRVKDGTVVIMFMVLYFSTRFFLEYFKEYQFMSPSFPLTMGQLLSIPIVLIGLYLLFVKKYYKLLPEDRIFTPMDINGEIIEKPIKKEIPQTKNKKNKKNKK